MGRIAYVGNNEHLKLFFNMVGIQCFDDIKNVSPDVFSVALVDEELFKKIDISLYFGKLLIMPFRSIKNSLSKKLWFDAIIRGEIFK